MTRFSTRGIDHADKPEPLNAQPERRITIINGRTVPPGTTIKVYSPGEKPWVHRIPREHGLFNPLIEDH